MVGAYVSLCEGLRAGAGSLSYISGVTTGGQRGAVARAQQSRGRKVGGAKVGFMQLLNKPKVAYSFYRAMHFSANARSWDRMSSVRLSVCPSVTLVDCDHIGWKSWKLIARTISPIPSLFVAKRRST